MMMKICNMCKTTLMCSLSPPFIHYHKSQDGEGKREISSFLFLLFGDQLSKSNVVLVLVSTDVLMFSKTNAAHVHHGVTNVRNGG